MKIVATFWFVVWLLASMSLQAQPLADQSLIAKGEYLTRVGDCVACHTVRGGKPFAGGREMVTPFGSVQAPNITPDTQSGIGRWSFDDFWRAMHEGKRADGALLYPVFPYTSFTKVTHDDAFAIYAYLKSLPPVRTEQVTNRMDFPYGIRPLLTVWRALYFEQGEYQPDSRRSDSWNRGAYLVQGLGHCNQCHTTRNALGAMNAKRPLGGGQIPAQGWYAPDLSMQPGGGLPGWSRDDVVALLKTGTSAKGAVFGPMAEVVWRSTQYLTDDDLAAVAEYLQSLPAPTVVAPVAKVAQAPDYAAGRELYDKACSVCHGKNGEGAGNIYPPLQGNGAVLEASAINAVRMVLLGGFAPATASNPMPYSMPPFANSLNNAQVAQVLNYVRQSWGNMAAPITAAEVASYRYLPLQ